MDVGSASISHEQDPLQIICRSQQWSLCSVADNFHIYVNDCYGCVTCDIFFQHLTKQTVLPFALYIRGF